MQILKTTIFTFMLLFFFVPSAQAGQVTTTYDFPDIRDDFCGLAIDFRYCKCAFHGEWCDFVAMPKKGANNYVWNEYREWVRGFINEMGAKCKERNGIWSSSKRSCTICTDGYVRKGNTCVEKTDEEQGDEEVEVPEGFNRDCTVDRNFEAQWEKYSDIDDAIDVGTRSYEAGQYASTIENLIKKKAQLHNEMIIQEVYRVAGEAKRDMHEALKNNLRANLLKSFWRLTYVTYTTIKSGVSTGDTFVDFVDPKNVIDGLSKGIKLIQAAVPADSTLAIDTNTTSGKVRSIGANAALEIVDTWGDPVKIVTKVFDDSIKATFPPSADLTDADIKILRTEYLSERRLHIEIQENHEARKNRHKTIMSLKKEIGELIVQARTWKHKEKARVKDMLEDNCKKQMKNK